MFGKAMKKRTEIKKMSKNASSEKRQKKRKEASQLKQQKSKAFRKSQLMSNRTDFDQSFNDFPDDEDYLLSRDNMDIYDDIDKKP